MSKRHLIRLRCLFRFRALGRGFGQIGDLVEDLEKQPDDKGRDERASDEPDPGVVGLWGPMVA